MPSLHRARALGLALVALTLPAQASTTGSAPPLWTRALDLGPTELRNAKLVAGDLDGDGLDDLVLASPDEGLDVDGEGVVRVFLGASGLVSGLPDRVWTGGEAGAKLGAALLVVDLDEDGLDDVVAGAPTADGATLDEGVLHLFYGDDIDLPDQADTLWLSTFGQGMRVGTALAAGDVDGDGAPELLVACPRAQVIAAFEGPHVAHAVPIVEAPWPTFLLSAVSTPKEGGSIATGDVNGDGFDDVVASDGSGPGVAIWYGRSDPDLAPKEAAFTPSGHHGDGDSGHAAALHIEDLDRNGFADLLIGIPDAYGSTVDSYITYQSDVVLRLRGSVAGLDPAGVLTLRDHVDYLGFGSAIATGDLTGDGWVDVLIGNPASTLGVPNPHRIATFLGSSAGVTPAITGVWLADTLREGLGEAFTLGDFDGDGLLDVAATARRPVDASGGRAGEVHLLLAAPPPPTLSRPFLLGSTFGEGLGTGLAAGDVNGDGLDDVVVGAPRASAASTAEGRTCVHLGSTHGPNPIPWKCWTGGDHSRCLGAAVEVADLDRDGIGDVVALASGCRDDGVRPPEREVRAWLGRSSALPEASDWTYTTEEKVYAMTSLRSSTDGQERVVLGMPLYDEDGWFLRDYRIVDPGFAIEAPSAFHDRPHAAHRFLDHGGLLGDESGLFLEGEFERFGEVLTAGDFDGDGLDELVSRLRVQGDRGGVRVVPPKEHPDPAIYRERLVGDAAWVELGRVIAAGDVDGDGLDDLVVGSPDFPHPTEARGRIAVHYGTPRGPSAAPGVVWQGDAPGVHLGAVLTVVDLDHDGRAEIVAGRVGDPQASLAVFSVRPRTQRTASDLFRRTLDQLVAYQQGLIPHPLVTEVWRGLPGVMPRTLASGDVNGDGWEDVLVGHEGAHSGWGEGAVHLLYGRQAALGLTPPPVVDGDRDGVALHADCDDADPGVGRAVQFNVDADLDGYGARYGGAWLCSHPTWVPSADDCDDTDPLIFPGAPEACDGVDEDCNGRIDDDPSFPDADADGLCDAADACPLDPVLPEDDHDDDGICNHDDVCTGDDPTGDPDGDGLCTDRDRCFGDNSTGDIDQDALCDGLDFMLTLPGLTLGQRATLTVLRAAPGSTITWYVTAEGDGREPQPCEDPAVPCLLLTNASVLGQRVADATGSASLTITTPSTMTDRKIHFQASSFDGVAADVTPVVHRTVRNP